VCVTRPFDSWLRIVEMRDGLCLSTKRPHPSFLMLTALREQWPVTLFLPTIKT
jgi:hypothetical protein